MFRSILAFFGIGANVPAYVAPQTIQDGRPMSNVECKVRIRYLLSDPRFKFRKLSTIARAIGCDVNTASNILADMPDVRPSRSNRRIYAMADHLYTFARTPVASRRED